MPAKPVFKELELLECDFGGHIGERLSTTVNNRLTVVPHANRALTQMVRDRDREPRQSLMARSGSSSGNS